MVARRFQTQAGRMEQITSGRARHGERSGSIWSGFNLVQKVFGSCAAKTVTIIDDSMQARENGYERVWDNVETNLNPRKVEVLAKNARGWTIEGQTKQGSQGRNA